MSLFEVRQLLCTFWTEKNKLIWRLHGLNSFMTSPRWVACCSLKKTKEIWRLLRCLDAFHKKKYKKTLPKLKNGDESWISLGINEQKVKKLRTHKKKHEQTKIMKWRLKKQDIFNQQCPYFFAHALMPSSSMSTLPSPNFGGQGTVLKTSKSLKAIQSENFSQQKHPERNEKNPPKLWWFLW